MGKAGVDSDSFQPLPSGIDPFGKNGEYPCFVSDALIHRKPVPCGTREAVLMQTKEERRLPR
jgi:hypothetical protein